MKATHPSVSFVKAAALAVAFLSIAVSPLSVGRVSAQATQAQEAGGQIQIDSLAVTGNSRLDPSVILGTTHLRAGMSVSYLDLQRAVKTLWSTGQFSDIQVRAVGSVGEPVTLVFEVEEQILLRTVSIEGLEHANAREATDTAGLGANQFYAPTRVALAKDFIRSELSREGIPYARIEERLEPIPDREGEANLVIEVTEGNRITVAEVSFAGNEIFNDSELQGQLDTKGEGFFWFRSGSYDEETFRTDLETKLPGFYAARGYLDFRLLSDSLIVDSQTGKTRIEVTVDEGLRYRLAGLTIEGNRRFPTEDLERYFRPEAGGLLSSLGFGGDAGEERPIYNASQFESATQQVQTLYGNEGYLYAQVEPWIEKLEVEEGEEPAVQVGWRIYEGNPAYINRISIAGNDFTYDRVIRERILILPGDVFSQDRLIQSYQSISGLGFFENPLPSPSVDPDPVTGDVDIIFHVAERQTGSVNFGTAVGGGTGVSGFLGYDQPNLFGQGKQGHLRWDFGKWISNFTITFQDPSLFQSLVSGTISLFNSRDRFYQFQSGQRRRLGASVRFGFPVPGHLRSRVFVGYSLSRTKYEMSGNADDQSLFGIAPGTQSQLSLGFTRSTLNHPLFPTSGSRQSVNTEFNGGLLGGDGDFIRQLADASWWIPVGQLGGGQPDSRPIILTLGLTVSGGAIFGNADRFPFDRFWMGGVQFGQMLRGYDETSITPLGYFPDRAGDIADAARMGDAFLLLTMEYALRLNDNISLSTFFDAGNVWRDPLNMNSTRLFRGAGLGVQLVTPFGPIGIDYAYGFDKTEPGWQLHFKMGQGF